MADFPQPTSLLIPGSPPSAGGLASSVESSTAPRTGGAKVRILTTATRLFYQEGLRSVGVDRLIAEARVTKATFYKHYGSKGNLVLAYMRAMHEHVVSVFDTLTSSADTASDAVRAWIASVVDFVNGQDFRGCPFLNAAAEVHDPDSPIRAVITEHRDWYMIRLTELLRDAGHPLPGEGADELMLARDGVMFGAYTGDAVAATTAFSRVARHVLDAP